MSQAYKTWIWDGNNYSSFRRKFKSLSLDLGIGFLQIYLLNPFNGRLFYYELLLIIHIFRSCFFSNTRIKHANCKTSNTQSIAFS